MHSKIAMDLTYRAIQCCKRARRKGQSIHEGRLRFAVTPLAMSLKIAGRVGFGGSLLGETGDLSATEKECCSAANEACADPLMVSPADLTVEADNRVCVVLICHC